jgi:hypothetical protein
MPAITRNAITAPPHLPNVGTSPTPLVYDLTSPDFDNLWYDHTTSSTIVPATTLITTKALYDSLAFFTGDHVSCGSTIVFSRAVPPPKISLWMANNPINFRDPSGLQSMTNWAFGTAFKNQCECHCGVDITDQLKDILNKFSFQVKQWSGQDKIRLVTEADSLGGWDIHQLAHFKGTLGGQGKGERTVTVAGHCYPAEEVNYFLWGLIVTAGTEGSQELRLVKANPTQSTVYMGQPAMAPTEQPLPSYNREWGKSEIAWYRLAAGWALSWGDQRGFGTNAAGRIAWYEVGFDAYSTHGGFNMGLALNKIENSASPTNCIIDKKKNSWSLSWHAGTDHQIRGQSTFTPPNQQG